MPIITYTIIALTVLISMQGFNSSDFSYKMSFSPYLAKHYNQKTRFFTHMFVHADWGHLFFNMFSFYMFGRFIELELRAFYGDYLGGFHFLVLYLLGGLFSTLWPFIRNQDNDTYFSVGASGAVSAIIFSTIIWYPQLEMGLIFLPIMVPGYIFGPLYLLFEFFAFRYGKSKIAHDAHIGGALFGIVYIIIINIDKANNFVNQILN
ncbi:MAG: rhomboid family intramembrane serine protease [Crocinitomicaceae bacterium]|nr:MAG: rhomboid family intramembrane serine protease [Crocinitomicaceae bacterium]